MPLQLAILDAGAHDTAAQYSGLFAVYLAVMAAGGALVTAAVLLSVLRSRRRRDPRSHGAFAGRLEAAWILALAVVAAALVALTFRTESGEDALARNPQLRIAVTASQWRWQFSYAGGRAVQQGPSTVLRVPVGALVEFSLRSRDVLHSFWIPAMRFKRYAYPDHVNRFDLVFRRPGRLHGVCAQFCGVGHDGMLFDVLVMPPGRFRAWLSGSA